MDPASPLGWDMGRIWGRRSDLAAGTLVTCLESIQSRSGWRFLVVSRRIRSRGPSFSALQLAQVLATFSHSRCVHVPLSSRSCGPQVMRNTGPAVVYCSRLGCDTGWCWALELLEFGGGVVRSLWYMVLQEGAGSVCRCAVLVEALSLVA